RLCDFDCVNQNFAQWKRRATLAPTFESERLVEGRFRTGSILGAVRQLHHVIKEALHLVSPHVQQGELPALLGRKPGEGFESAEFVLVGLRMWVPVAPHD